jgi:tRNA A-37 threonylcarbamoyl transferase component Bud32
VNEPALPLVIRLAGGPAFIATHTLRVLPGRRWVLGGTCARTPAVAKLFLADTARARRDYARECAGLSALARAGLRGPALLHAGCAGEPAGWCVVTARLPGRPLLECADDAPALRAWIGALAGLHRAGLTQTDPHLGNFLWDGAQLALLDPGGVRRAPQLRWRGPARRALSRALCELPVRLDAQVPALVAHYAAARGWPDAHARRGLGAALARARQARARRFAAKSRRRCREFDAGRIGCWRYALDRRADSPALRALLADPEAAFGARARWLKQGRSAQVVRVDLPGGPAVLKRYVARDAVRALRRAWRPSRAARAWDAALALTLFGVPTAAPIALLEPRPGLRRRAYLLTAWVGGVPFDRMPDPAAHAPALRALLAAFAALRMRHGDLKASNVLIDSSGQARVLDLDAAALMHSGAAAHRAHAQDRARLLANLDQSPLARSALARALEEST